jgi:DNA-binding HxlR family transcriptional regulator
MARGDARRQVIFEGDEFQPLPLESMNSAPSGSDPLGPLYAEGSPIWEFLDHSKTKWGGLVLIALAQGTRRFKELREVLPGISEKMLTQTLRMGERDGVLRREQYAEVPPRVDYSLTELGLTLADLAIGFHSWFEENLTRVLAAQHEYDSRNPESGRPTV